jgi:pimeloyl-ACP methyl ester carboxylesterase
MGKKAASLSENLQYVEIPNTGHFPMLENRELYLSLVRDFLNYC